jgi:hypothetical protein
MRVRGFESLTRFSHDGKGEKGMSKLVKYEDIQPPMSEENWKINSYDKVDIINGEMYHNMDTSHWSFNIVKTTKQFTPLGFYTNSEKPDEVVRVAGQAPRLYVIRFIKKV